MRTRVLVIVLLVVAMAVAVAPVAAQSDDGGTDYTVQPGDSLFKIAQQFGTTVAAIVRANNLANADLIFAGQTLVIPSGATVAPSTVGIAAPSSGSSSTGSTTGTTYSPGAIGGTSTLGTAEPGAWSATVGTPQYSYGGDYVDIPITVTNNSVTPEIAGGRYSAILKPDGLWEDQTLLKAQHGVIERPLTTADTTLWETTVTLSDGTSHFMTVGCVYEETVYAEGWEPLSYDAQGNWLDKFFWQVSLYDGWFDCGNSHRVNPANILPGQSATSILRVYLQNPFLKSQGQIVGAAYPQRSVTSIDLSVRRQDASLVGTTTLAVPQP